MFINDIILQETDGSESATPPGYRSEKEDQSVLQLSDMRKTRLTLGQLNKLRQLSDVRKIEFEQKVSKLKAQYAAPEADAGGM